MPVTIDQLLSRVAQDVATAAGQLVGSELEPIVRATIRNLGLYVNDFTGEVYDPAPKPVVNYPEQRSVHYRGQPRRRRSGRR